MCVFDINTGMSRGQGLRPIGMARLFLDQAQRNDKIFLWSSTDVTSDCPLAKTSV